MTGCRPEVRHGPFVAGLPSRACRRASIVAGLPSRSWCAQLGRTACRGHQPHHDHHGAPRRL